MDVCNENAKFFEELGEHIGQRSTQRHYSSESRFSRPAITDTDGSYGLANMAKPINSIHAGA